MINYYYVIFKNSDEQFLCKSKNINCPINVTVIVKTERGEQFGKIVKKLSLDDLQQFENINEIIRISTKNDYKTYLEILKMNKEALKEAEQIVKNMELNMRLLEADYTFDKSQLMFNFVSDERIDFRDLLKKLAFRFKTRIELRQIGARDKAKKVSGIGICGRELCCANFLKHIETVGINMAKNQNISLNPNKINGSCGRLLCCLTYEDSMYTNLRSGMPNLNDEVDTEFGKGKVILVDILNRKYKVVVNNEIKEIRLDNNENSKE